VTSKNQLINNTNT